MNNIENCGKRSISEWARYYREFVRRQRFLGRWPLTDSERKTVWGNGSYILFTMLLNDI